MFLKRCGICGLLIFVLVFELVVGQDGTFFLKASKNVPRIGKRSKHNNNNNNDDFEKFFLKASKSVPRIGRRGSPDYPGQRFEKSGQPWSDISDILEYNPEIFTTPQLLSQLEDYTMLGDDPTQWDRIRYKRENKEIPEYRIQI